MKKLTTYVLAGLFALIPNVNADTLMIEAISNAPSNSEAGLLRPKKGITQKQVKKQFGEPIATTPEVGYPPITSWRYDNFTVYFEFELVINTVVHRE